MELDTAQVTMYGTANCRPCKMTKRFFQQNGIAYIYKDITDEANLSEVHELGYKSVPVVVSPSGHFGGGYNPDALAGLVK